MAQPQLVDRDPIKEIPDYMYQEARGGAFVLAYGFLALTFAAGVCLGAWIF